MSTVRLFKIVSSLGLPWSSGLHRPEPLSGLFLGSHGKILLPLQLQRGRESDLTPVLLAKQRALYIQQ